MNSGMITSLKTRGVAGIVFSGGTSMCRSSVETILCGGINSSEGSSFPIAGERLIGRMLVSVSRISTS